MSRIGSSEKFKHICRFAGILAKCMGHQEYEPCHLLLSLYVNDNNFADVFDNYGFDYTKATYQCQEMFEQNEDVRKSAERSMPSPKVLTMLSKASYLARIGESEGVEVKHLTEALLLMPGSQMPILEQYVRRHVIWSRMFNSKERKRIRNEVTIEEI